MQTLLTPQPAACPAEVILASLSSQVSQFFKIKISLSIYTEYMYVYMYTVADTVGTELAQGLTETCLHAQGRHSPWKQSALCYLVATGDGEIEARESGLSRGSELEAGLEAGLPSHPFQRVLTLLAPPRQDPQAKVPKGHLTGGSLTPGVLWGLTKALKP